MRNNQFIFNEKTYDIYLAFKVDEGFDATHKSIISVKHNRNRLQLAPTKLSSTKSNLNEDNTIVRFEKIKCWSINKNYDFRWGSDNDYGIFNSVPVRTILEDAHNKYCFNLLSKYQNNIEKLRINISDKNIIKHLFDESETTENVKFSFPNLNILQLTRDVLANNKLRVYPNTFEKLQCLDIEIGQNNMDSIQDIFNLTSDTLRAVRIYSGDSMYIGHRGHGRRRNKRTNDAIDYLKFPPNLEWILLKHILISTFDLSECNKLIGIKLVEIKSKSIKWPKDDHVIPFCSLCDDTHSNDWKKLVIDKVLNVQFVLLMKTKQNVDNFIDWNGRNISAEHKFNNDIDLDDKRIAIDSVLEKIKIEDDDKKMDENLNDKCFILQETDIDENLYKKVLRYSCKDQRLYGLKILQYQKWWALGSMNWIKLPFSCK